MHEVSHGGFCCGITHIYGFPASPTSVLVARVRRSAAEQAEYLTENPFHIRIVNDEYPQQPASERLKQMIDNIEKGIPDIRIGRSKGIIEVVITNLQKPYWEETLLSLGFLEVNSSMNSNSLRTIHVFHRNSGASAE